MAGVKLEGDGSGGMAPCGRAARVEGQGTGWGDPVCTTLSALTTTVPYEVVKFTNCRVFLDGSVKWEDVWVKGGRIIDPQRRFWEASSLHQFSCDCVVDCGGALVAPGFVDVQFNGAYGIDFSDPGELTVDNVVRVLARLPETGVTAVCPTIVSSSPTTYHRVVETFRAVRAQLARWHTAFAERDDAGLAGAPGAMARLCGLHLEGPFITLERRGAHAAHNVRSEVRTPCVSGVTVVDSEEAARVALKEVYGDVRWEGDEVAIVTCAPELPGATAMIRMLAKRGVVVSMGHTSANVKEADAGIDAGATMVTHMFNAMTGFHHRDPGVPALLGRRSTRKARALSADGVVDGDGGGGDGDAIPGSLPVHGAAPPTSMVMASHGAPTSTLPAPSQAREFSLQRVAPVAYRRVAPTRTHHLESDASMGAPGLTHTPSMPTPPALPVMVPTTSTNEVPPLPAGAGLRLSIAGPSLLDPHRAMYATAAASGHHHHHHHHHRPSLPGVHALATKEEDGGFSMSTTRLPSSPAAGVAEEGGRVGHPHARRPAVAPRHSITHTPAEAVVSPFSCPHRKAGGAPPGGVGGAVPLLPAGKPYYGLIVDGVHNHPYAVNLAVASHPTGLVLVTDAMKAMGLPVGKHALGELEVDIAIGRPGDQYEGLHAVLAGTSTLAGAVVPLDECVRNLRAFTHCTVPLALASVTTHPTHALGLQHQLGSLAPGRWADMVILDDNLHPQATFVAGQLAWKRAATPRRGSGCTA